MATIVILVTVIQAIIPPVVRVLRGEKFVPDDSNVRLVVRLWNGLVWWVGGGVGKLEIGTGGSSHRVLGGGRGMHARRLPSPCAWYHSHPLSFLRLFLPFSSMRWSFWAGQHLHLLNGVLLPRLSDPRIDGAVAVLVR